MQTELHTFPHISYLCEYMWKKEAESFPFLLRSWYRDTKQWVSGHSIGNGRNEIWIQIFVFSVKWLWERSLLEERVFCVIPQGNQNLWQVTKR